MEPKKNKDKYNSCLMIQNFFHLREFCTGNNIFQIFYTLRTYQQDHTSNVVQGRVDGTPLLQYFEKALLLVENL